MKRSMFNELKEGIQEMKEDKDERIRSWKMSVGKNLKRGETIPQTVENLQAVMEADAVLIEQLDRELKQTKVKLNQAKQSVRKWRTKYYHLLAAGEEG